MAGNKNSGRRAWDKEVEMKELWDLSIPVLKKALTGETEKISASKKVEIALALVSKFTPQQPAAVINNNIEQKVDILTMVRRVNESESNEGRNRIGEAITD